jgi:hypothetical protein
LKYTTLRVFHLQFEAIPTPESDDAEHCGGAFVNCWIRADNGEEAMELASQAVRENLWRILEVSEECGEVTESDYESDEEGMSYFREALHQGECFVYHQWPNEPQEGDVVH